MPLQCEALSDVGGIEINGLDVTQLLTPNVKRELGQALDDHAVLLIRDTPLSASELVRLSECFGELQPHVQRAYQHPQVPEVVVMTNRKADGRFDDAGARRGASERTRDGWHSDLSYDPVPAKATLLHSIDVPSRGGNTCFCNTHRAYQSLPEDLKIALDGLEAEFVYGGHTRNASTQLAASMLDAKARTTAHAVHPVINKHPVTRRPGIYANPLITTRILGVSDAQSETMLEQLFDALEHPSFRFEHQWQVGDTLIWDNRGGLMHTGRLDYPRSEARRFIRTTVRGAPLQCFRISH